MSQGRPVSTLLFDPDAGVVRSLCTAFEQRFSAGERPTIEEYLPLVAAAVRPQLLSSLVALECVLRRGKGELPGLDEYLVRFPGDRDLLEQALAKSEPAEQSFLSTANFAAGGVGQTLHEIPALPEPGGISRYQLTGPLGKGAFGQVWRAYDPDLKRDVAIKIPRPDRQHSPESLQRFLFEAQRIAQLNCDGIVRVYDVGRNSGGFFIVSELFEGGTLADRIPKGDGDTRARLPFDESARLMADVAAAIHRVHTKDITHRDLKPSNILLDGQGRPAIADFGLAVSEREQLEEPSSSAGTLAYMSPEQARGDSNRVDARSDIYSLGVILYQLLCGRMPFVGKDSADYRQQILTREPRPPRTIDDTIPAELERICLKCLAKQPSERYTTARDLAVDLRDYSNRRQPRAGYAWKVMLAAGVLVIGGLLIAAFVPSTRPTGTSTVELNPVQEQWTKVFGKSPGLLPFPGFQGEGILEWSLQKRALDLDSTDVRLVQLGDSDGRDFRLQIDCQRTSWSDGSGVFLGYHLERIGQAVCPAFQLIWLREVETADGGRQFRICRWKAHIQTRTATLHTAEPLHRLDLPWPTSPPMPRLEIQVRHRNVTKIVWCGQEVPELISDFAESKLSEKDYIGPFGLFHEKGAAWFAEPVFEILKGSPE